MADYDVNVRIRSQFDSRGFDQASAAARQYHTRGGGAQARAFYAGGGRPPPLPGQSGVAGAAAATRAQRGGIMPFGLSPAVIGAGVGALGLRSLGRDVISFESAMAGIQTKAGATAEEMVAIREGISNIAQDDGVIASMDDILGAYERGAAAGIPLDELEDFVRLMAKAAPALDMSGEALGNAVSQLASADVIELSGADDFLDLVNALEDAGTSNASDILDFMNRAGANAGIFGLEAEQAAALGAAMIDLGINSAQAATAMNASFTKLSAPASLSADGQAALEELYGSTEQWTELVEQDAQGAMMDLLDRLGELEGAARSGLVTDLFGLEHADIIQRLIEGIDTIRDRQALAANESSWLGNLDETLAIRLETVAGQFDILKRKLAELTISAGEMGLPAVNSAIEATIDLVDGLRTAAASVEFDGGPAAELAEQLGRIAELLSTEDTGMSNEFSSMAQDAQTIASVIETVQQALGFVAHEIGDLVEFAQDPSGFTSDEQRSVEAQEGLEAARTRGGRINEYLEGWPTRLREGWSGLLGQTDEQQQRALASQMQSDASQPRLSEIAPPVPSGLATGASEITVRPEIDDINISTFMGHMAADRQQFESPFSTTANIDAAAFNATLDQMIARSVAARQAIQANLSGISTSGSGSSYPSVANDQFAPVTP